MVNKILFVLIVLGIMFTSFATAGLEVGRVDSSSRIVEMVAEATGSTVDTSLFCLLTGCTMTGPLRVEVDSAPIVLYSSGDGGNEYTTQYSASRNKWQIKVGTGRGFDFIAGVANIFTFGGSAGFFGFNQATPAAHVDIVHNKNTRGLRIDVLQSAPYTTNPFEIRKQGVNQIVVENATWNFKSVANITSANVFIPQYIFSHTNATIPLIGVNTWTNITFSQEDSDIKQGISHTYNDATNHTFMIMKAGIYNVDYDLDVEDTSVSASDINVAARLILEDGTEVSGSVFEIDITKQGTETELSHNFLMIASAGDVLVFQFIADDADVQISTHGTFGDHPESATVLMNKIGNIP